MQVLDADFFHVKKSSKTLRRLKLGTLYTLITGLSIVGIKIVDIILSLIFDCISFAIAWKIGGLGNSAKIRGILHWSSRIAIYVLLVVTTKNIIL